MSQKDAFEAWRKDRLTMDGYPQFSAEDAWVAAWKASRRAAIEESAKVCDAREDWYEKDDCRGQACAAAGCANDIRALATGDKHE